MYLLNLNELLGNAYTHIFESRVCTVPEKWFNLYRNSLNLSFLMVSHVTDTRYGFTARLDGRLLCLN